MILALALQGCASAGYYGHLLAGQFQIWRDREPIDEVLAAGALPAPVAERLALAARARDFSFDTLALPDNGSFRYYVELDRAFVIWNVFAAPELSLVPRQFCYPFAGCFSYRGFFAEKRARDYADTLRRDGFDVYVGGVAAYSTLGWLNDPVLSSILNQDETRIAEIVFHELAHELLYIPGDTTFNESFAMSVATAGLARWLPLQGGDFAEVENAQLRQDQFIDLLLKTREDLAVVFEGNGTIDDKRSAKQSAYRRLHADYLKLKASWSNDGSYDAWMESGLNNAKLASISTYHDHVGAFMTILERGGDDLPAFYRSVRRLADLPTEDRNACLNALTAGSEIGEAMCTGIYDIPGH